MQFSHVRNEGLHHDKGSMLLLFRKEGEITFSRDGLDCADHRSRAILCSGLSSYVKTNLAEAGFCFSDIDGSAEPPQTYRVSYLVGFILFLSVGTTGRPSAGRRAAPYGENGENQSLAVG